MVKAPDGSKRVRKTVNTEGMAPSTLAIMKEEIAALALLDNPHIVRVFSHIEVEGALYIFLEIVSGGDVDQAIKKRGKLSESTTARLARQALIAIAYVHSKGILHRDIKPENLMLSTTNPDTADLKVIDFGLAQVFQPGEEKHSTFFAGTLPYMPPEVFETLKGGVGYSDAYDMYSIGATLYEMIS